MSRNGDFALKPPLSPPRAAGSLKPTLKAAADIVLDNPILMKHVRSRLRVGQTLPWAVIVLVLSACIAWAGFSINWFGVEVAMGLLIGLQILILAFGGANQIHSSLGAARESGILDFHRVSPVPPSVVTLGFFLGAPIREYLLAAIVLPFALFVSYLVDVVDSWKGVRWFAQFEVAVLLSIWVIHAATMLGCLTRKKPRGSVQGTIVTVIFVLFVAYFGSIGTFFGAKWLLDFEPKLNFFGLMVPWLPWLLLYELPALGFLGLAAARKMRAERTHAYTKRQALACMATLTVLTLGGLWKISRLLPAVPPFEPTPADAIMLAATYVLALAAMILAASITPNAAEYLRGLRRAEHIGHRRASPWSDAGSNRIALFGLCALILLGASTVVYVVGRQPLLAPPALPGWPSMPEALGRATLTDEAWLASRQSIMSRPIAIAVLTAAYVGLAFQYFSVRTRRSGLVLTMLFLFTVWLVPPLIGAVLGMGGPPDQSNALVVLALSPLAGIALSSGLNSPPRADAIQLAALAPAITFAFLFNYLLVTTQRKIDRQMHATEKSTPVLDLDTGRTEKRNGLPIEDIDPQMATQMNADRRPS